MNRVIFSDKIFYSTNVCPYVFMNTNLNRVSFLSIANSFIYKNRLEFIDINETGTFDLGIKRLDVVEFSFAYEHFSQKILNTLVFKKVLVVILQGIIYGIQTDLFTRFRDINCVSLSVDNHEQFLHGGTSWMSSLNSDLDVNLTISLKFRDILARTIVLESLPKKKVFSSAYTYPNEDICMFKNFPHKQLVYPALVFEKQVPACSCTIIWLMQYSNIYLNNDYTDFVNQIRTPYPESHSNNTARKCFLKKNLQNLTKSCNFAEKFKNCNLKIAKKFGTFDNLDAIILFKWFQYVLEVGLKPSLCFIGIITNTLVICVIKNHKKEHSFKKTMYTYMLVNSVFNLIFCGVSSFSLINVCIFPKTSFCSSIFKEAFSQYFKIYVVDFLGEAVRFCCNVSFFIFSVSRFFTSIFNSNTKIKFLNYAEKINTSHLFGIVLCIGLLLNLFKLFEYKKNMPYSTIDTKFPFNAYDIEYCENRLIVSSTFALRCRIFPVINLINSILNNIIYLFISVIIDVLLINFSNRNLERKKKLTNEKEQLEHAIKLKEKVNKMVITNGSLYFVSHFPQFLITLILFVYKSRLSSVCFYYIPCNEFLELMQTFNLISIGFQFFIFKKFDKNIHESYKDLKLRFQE